MNVEVVAFVLLTQLIGVAWGGTDYSHCINYAEYNTLANLMKNDTCMQADSVFKLLTAVNVQDGGRGGCRIHLIYLLANHFGRHASTPAHCHCQGLNKLQEYHTEPVDGITNLKDYCLQHSWHYKDMYNQFFESQYSNHHYMACRTHHSVWSALRSITTNTHENSSCQKDIIFRLKYAFEHLTDHCSCTGIPTHVNGHQGYDNDKCHHYNSFNKLQQLAETDGCLSANSVWHYLDDLQVKAPVCRERIQKHLSNKYSTSQGVSHCTCNERRHLVNHEIHRMNNGSFLECKYSTSGTYRDIEVDLFSNIRTKGCQNHDYLWAKLEGIHNHCSRHNIYRHCEEWVDCTKDLIVRAAIQYPTDDSDSCVCSKITSPTLPATLTSSTKAPTSAMTSPSSTPTTATKAPTSAATTPSPTPTTPPPASATSVKVTQSSTSGMSTQRTTSTIKFACNKLAVVEDIARSLKATHPDSSYCNPSAGGSDDAYVLSTCNMASPMTWKKGANVMADCESSTQLIPTYTPISTFDGNSYTPLGAQSGIFLGCDNNGIKIAIQKCNGLPEIVHIGNGAFIDNSRNYYVVV